MLAGLSLPTVWKTQAPSMTEEFHALYILSFPMSSCWVFRLKVKNPFGVTWWKESQRSQQIYRQGQQKGQHQKQPHKYFEWKMSDQTNHDLKLGHRDKTKKTHKRGRGDHKTDKKSKCPCFEEVSQVQPLARSKSRISSYSVSNVDIHLKDLFSEWEKVRWKQERKTAAQLWSKVVLGIELAASDPRQAN